MAILALSPNEENISEKQNSLSQTPKFMSDFKSGWEQLRTGTMGALFTCWVTGEES